MQGFLLLIFLLLWNLYFHLCMLYIYGSIPIKGRRQNCGFKSFLTKAFYLSLLTILLPTKMGFMKQQFYRCLKVKIAMNQRYCLSWIWRNLPFEQKGLNQHNKRLKLPFAMPPMNCSMKRKVLLERMFIICVLQYCVILFLWKERFCWGKN